LTALTKLARAGHLNKVSYRVTADLKRKLEAAASVSGRSLSAEMEHRLERSFDLPAFAEDVASQVVRKLKDSSHG
jgi:hypothetical protein